MLVSFVVTEICSAQNLSMKKQWAITFKSGSGGLWFLCSALLPNEIYRPLKFHLSIRNSLWSEMVIPLKKSDTGFRKQNNLPNSHKLLL